MIQKDYRTQLGFSDQWFSLNILTEDDLQIFATRYETSDDKNTEHYRYGVFRWYLKEHRPLSASTAQALYDLGASDSDGLMGESIMVDILLLPECPASVLDKALASDRKPLVRVARRRRLLSDLQQGPLTAELFSQCIGSRDDTVHHALLKRDNLTRQQLQMLAEQGTRAIRNMAVVKLERSST